MRSCSLLLLCCLLAAGCHELPTGHDSGDPREAFVLAETARFAAALRINVHARLTDTVFLAPSEENPQMLVPASGWYNDGWIFYWRPIVLRSDEAFLTALARHEVCHYYAPSNDSPILAACLLLTRP